MFTNPSNTPNQSHSNLLSCSKKMASSISILLKRATASTLLSKLSNPILYASVSPLVTRSFNTDAQVTSSDQNESSVPVGRGTADRSPFRRRDLGSSFLSGIGVCEQLIGTLIPLSYTRLTSRFLVLWHLTLPIIPWDDCHWIVVPATFISAASLFCIEEVGVLIEEPFPMLALDDLCKSVRNNVHEALASEKLIHAWLAAKGKIQSEQQFQNGQPRP